MKTMSTKSNNLRKPVPFDELTIQNDFLFQKVMENKHICKRLIEGILNIKIANISFIQTQKHIKSFYNGKGVFLDVTVEDERHTRYNLEMQVRNERSHDSGEPLLPQRTRYYQSMLDANLLEAGQNYDKLTPTYIIFICPFDLFGEGRYIYTFRKLCIENKDLELDDKSTVIVLNALGNRGNITKSAKNFLHYVKSDATVDKFTQEIAAEITKIKQNEKVRREYMDYEIKMWDLQKDAFAKGLKRGVAQGVAQGIYAVATTMKKSGKYSDTAIADATNLTLEEIKAIPAQ